MGRGAQVVRMSTGGEAVEQRGGQLLVAEDSHSLGARSLKWNEATPQRNWCRV